MSTALDNATAIARLEASRQRLRDAMTPKVAPVREGRDGGPITGSPVGAALLAPISGWIERIRELPAVSLAIDTVEGWWSRHPLRPVVFVAHDTAKAALRPYAEQNPLALAAAAGMAGALLAYMRPWRWLFGSALFAGMVPRLALHLVRRVPIERLIGAASGLSRASAGASKVAAPPSRPRAAADALHISPAQPSLERSPSAVDRAASLPPPSPPNRNSAMPAL